MEGAARSLLQAASNAQGDTTAPFFGFMGAASALIFACAKLTLSPRAQCTASLSRAISSSCSTGRTHRWLAPLSPAPLPRVKHRSVDPRSRGLIRIFSCSAGFGAAYGTAKAGVGIASMGVLRPELVMKSIVPIVMAGVLGIYGLII